MGRFFSILFMGITFLFLGMLAVSYFVRPDAIQKEWETLVQKETGWTISSGEGTLAWTPYPTLDIDNFSLTNGQEKIPVLTAKKVQIELDVLALITGQYVIRRVKLQEPKMVLMAQNTPVFFNGLARIFRNPFLRSMVELGVNKGNFVFQSDVVQTLDNLDLRFNLKNYEAISVSGSGGFLNKKWFVKGGIEKIFQNAVHPFQFAVKDDKNIIKLDATGTFKNAQNIKMNGYIHVTEPNYFLEWLKLPVLISSWNVPTLGNFSFEKTPEQVGFSDFTLKFGEVDPILWNGRCLKKEGRYTLDLFVHELTDKAITEQLDIFHPFFLQHKMDLNFQLGVDKLSYQKMVATDVRVSGSLTGTDVAIDSGKFLLGTGLEVFYEGQGKEIGLPTYGWDLNYQVKTATLVPVLKEIFPRFEQVPETLFSNVAMTGKLLWTRPKITLDIQEGKISEASFTGQIQKEQGQPVILTLNMEQIPLDDYLRPIFPELYQSVPQETGLRERLFSFLKQPILGELIDGTLNFNAKDIYVLGEKADQISGTLTKDHNVLSLMECQGKGLFDTDFNLSGNLTQIGQSNPIIDKGILTLESENFPEFYQNITGEKLPFVEDKNAKISVNFEGTEPQLYVNALLKTPTISFEGKGNLLWKPQFQFDKFSLTLSYPNFQMLLRQLDIDQDIFKKIDGVFQAAFTISGQRYEMTIDDLTASIGTQNISGNLAYVGGEESVFKGNLTTDFLDLAKILPQISPGKNIDFASLYPALTDVQLQAGQVKYQDTLFKNAAFTYHQEGEDVKIAGTLEDKKVQFSVDIQDIENPVADIKIVLDDFGLKGKAVDYGAYYFGSGTLSGKADLTCQGTIPETCLPSMKGNFSFQGKRNMLVGIDVPGLAKVVNQGALGGLSAFQFQEMLYKTLGQGIWTLSESLISGKFAPNHLDWQTRLVGENATLLGDWTYDFGTQNGQGKGGVLLSDYEKLGEIPLEGTYQSNRVSLKWLAPNLYDGVKKNVVPVMQTQQEQNAIEKKFSALWRQKTLEYQGMWQDVTQWGKLPVNQVEQESALALKEEWDNFGVFSQEALLSGRMTFDDLIQHQNALVKSLESIYQKMLSNLEKESLTGEIY